MNIKNWSPLKWVLVASVLLSVLLFASVAGLTMFVLTSLKSSAAYEGSLERVQAEPAVIELLGEPIEPGLLVVGSVNKRNPVHPGIYSGEADISHRIYGPRGSGMVYVVATMKGDSWTCAVLSVDFDDREEDLELGGFLIPNHKEMPVLDDNH